MGAELPGLSITKGGGGDIEGTEGLWLPPWAPSLPPSALPAFSVLHSSLCSGSWNDTCEHRILVIYLSIIIVSYFVWAIKGWKEQEKKWIRMSHSEMIITFMHISVQKVFRVKEKKNHERPQRSTIRPVVLRSRVGKMNNYEKRK